MCDRAVWKLSSPFHSSNGSVKALFSVGGSRSLIIPSVGVAKKA